MKKFIKRMIILALGWILILLGIAGLFLPILQGFLFLLIGLLILSLESIWAHDLLHKIKERFPVIRNKIESAERKKKVILQRFLGKKK